MELEGIDIFLIDETHLRKGSNYDMSTLDHWKTHFIDGVEGVWRQDDYGLGQGQLPHVGTCWIRRMDRQ